MFLYNEIQPFKSNYFSHFSYKNHIVQVKSVNTGHWWKFEYVHISIHNMIRLYHKYSDEQPYHVQCHVNHVWKVLNVIKEHDKYILNNKTRV